MALRRGSEFFCKRCDGIPGVFPGTLFYCATTGGGFTVCGWLVELAAISERDVGWLVECIAALGT
jgi:hypothetical protein